MVRLLYQDELESYFDPAVVMEGRQVRYRDYFVSLVDRVNKSIGREDSSTREELQYYKDETTLTHHTFVSVEKIYRTPAGKDIWKKIFAKAFRAPETVDEFQALLNCKRKMALETPLPPTERDQIQNCQVDPI